MIRNIIFEFYQPIVIHHTQKFYSYPKVLLMDLKWKKLFFPITYEPRHEKTCLRVFANNTGTDQPAHPRSLISAFVIRFLESIVCTLATGENSIF